MKDLRQTPQYALYMQKIGWHAEWENGNLYYIKKFPLVGSVIKFQRPKELNHQDVKTIAKKHKAFHIIFEPTNELQELTLRYHGFKRSKSPYLPSKTIHIDVTKQEKELLKKMHHKTRYNIKVAIKNGVNVSTSNNLDQFAVFWQECAKTQRKMFISQKKEIIEIGKAFGKNAEILFAFPSGKSETRNLLAAILLLHTPDISYYMYAASTEEGKKLFAPTLLVWEALRRSKLQGSKMFDFEGIYDDRFPLPTWKGFSRFKKSFGGEEIMYPGAYTKLRFPV